MRVLDLCCYALWGLVTSEFIIKIEAYNFNVLKSISMKIM